MITGDRAIGAVQEAQAQAIRSKAGAAALTCCVPGFIRHDLAPPPATAALSGRSSGSTFRRRSPWAA